MSQPPPPPAPNAPVLSPAAHSVWDRLLDDLHKRPRRYINGVLLLAIPVLAIVLGIKFWKGRQDEAAGNLATTWQEIWDSDTDPKARAARLEELEPKLSTEDQKSLRLFDLARTQRDIAVAATTQEEMLAAYEKLLATCQELKSKYPNSLWMKLPVRPQNAPGATALSFVGQLEDKAQHEIAWLKAHPFQGIPEADPGLKATIELEDGRKIVIGKFFSRAAPYHVQNFVELARRGYFDGTGFSKVYQGTKKGAVRKQGERPPTIAAEAGHPMTKVTSDNRDDDETPNDIGYSVPEEQAKNNLNPVRGSIGAVQDFTTGGDSASRFKVFAEEPEAPQGSPQDTIFGQVTEGLEIVDAIVNAGSPDGHPTWTKDLIRIKKVTVEGSVANPPDRAFPPELKMPEGPKPESKPDSRAESGPESRGESRRESGQRPRDDGSSASRPR